MGVWECGSPDTATLPYPHTPTLSYMFIQFQTWISWEANQSAVCSR